MECSRGSFKPYIRVLHRSFTTLQWQNALKIRFANEIEWNKEKKSSSFSLNTKLWRCYTRASKQLSERARLEIAQFHFIWYIMNLNSTEKFSFFPLSTFFVWCACKSRGARYTQRTVCKCNRVVVQVNFSSYFFFPKWKQQFKKNSIQNFCDKNAVKWVDVVAMFLPLLTSRKIEHIPKSRRCGFVCDFNFHSLERIGKTKNHLCNSFDHILRVWSISLSCCESCGLFLSYSIRVLSNYEISDGQTVFIFICLINQTKITPFPWRHVHSSIIVCLCVLAILHYQQQQKWKVQKKKLQRKKRRQPLWRLV